MRSGIFYLERVEREQRRLLKKAWFRVFRRRLGVIYVVHVIEGAVSTHSELVKKN